MNWKMRLTKFESRKLFGHIFHFLLQVFYEVKFTHCELKWIDVVSYPWVIRQHLLSFIYVIIHF